MTDATGLQILPAIDLRGGQVVRLRQGDFSRETSYGDDPVQVAEGFVAAGARWLHVVDLDGARSGAEAHGPVIAAIVAAVGDRCSVEVAGGLRDEMAVSGVLSTAATRAVVGTAAIDDPAFAGRLVAAHGPDRIVVAIDVRDGRAIGRGWSTAAPGINAADAIDRLARAGVAIFEVTAIERDGLLEGPDLALYKLLVDLDAGAIIASGGIATLDDLSAIRDIGCAGAIVGRALYEGRFELADAISLGRE